MLFSGAVDIDFADLCEKKTRAPTIPIRSNVTAASAVQRARARPFRTISSFFGIWRLPISSEQKLTIPIRTPCFTSTSPRSCSTVANDRIAQDLRPRVSNQDVTGVAAVHHPLRDVDAGAGNVGALIDIDYFVHRPAVNAHSQLECWDDFSAPG